jgi:hypothetical protein
MMPRSTVGAAALAAILSALCWTIPAQAHKTVASRYAFNKDVLPILRQRCGHCHADGGVASPLLRYSEAKSAAWSIEQELLSGRMPPWNADALSTPFKGARSLPAKDFDVLMTWAASGAPEGAAVAAVRAGAVRPTPAGSGPGWPLGPPDVVMSMPEPFTLAGGQAEADREIVWPADRIAGRWIRAVDLLPGTPSVVRSATVALRAGGNERTIGLWIPGDMPQPFAGEGAFRVPEDASLVLRVHYQRPRGRSDTAVTDRSDVGVYVAPPTGAREVEAIDLRGDGEWPHEMMRVFTQPIDETVRLVALRPVSGPADAGVRLELIAADGSRTPLARLQLRQQWARRYVFVTPVVLPKGSRVEATVMASYGLSWMTLTGDRPVGPTEGGPFRLALEIIR